MDARAAIVLGLAAFAGVAYAMRAPREQGGIVPDYGGGPAPGLAPLGDWGPEFVFHVAQDFADVLGGVVTHQQSLGYAGLAQLKVEEGFSHTPYPDHKGYSIGYGHLIKPGENLTYVTEGEGEQLLLQDVADAERAVRTAVSVGLTQNQFDALVLLAYNIGAGAFKGSTLVRKLNAGDYAGAAAEFPRWNRASGQVNQVLVERRARERERFEA